MKKKMNRKKRDSVWNYFHENDDKTKYVCNMCENLYSVNMSISSMKKYCEVYHEKEFKDLNLGNKKMKLERKNKNKNRSQKISKVKKEKKKEIVINYSVDDKQLNEEKYSQIMMKDVLIENIGLF